MMNAGDEVLRILSAIMGNVIEINDAFIDADSPMRRTEGARHALVELVNNARRVIKEDPSHDLSR